MSTINCYFARYIRYAQGLILAILQCIPSVKFLHALVLDKIFHFLNGHYLELGTAKHAVLNTKGTKKFDEVIKIGKRTS